MEEVLSNLAHDATSSKAKSLRDACISATGKLDAIWRKSRNIWQEKTLIDLILAFFQMDCSSAEMEQEKSNPMSSGKRR